MGMVMGLLGGGGGGGLSTSTSSTAKNDSKTDQTFGNIGFGAVSVNNSKSNPWPWVIGAGAAIVAGLMFFFFKRKT